MQSTILCGTHVKKPPPPLEVEIIDSSLMAICRAFATPADVRSLGRRRKSGTCDAELRAARRVSLELAPTKAPELGTNAEAGASSDAHSTAAEKAATETRISRTASDSLVGGCGAEDREEVSDVVWSSRKHARRRSSSAPAHLLSSWTLGADLGTPLSRRARRPRCV